MSPLYAFTDDEGHEIDMFFPLEKSNEHPICERCGQSMYKDFSKVSILIDQTLGYYDRQLGRYIGSSSDRRKIMKEMGVTDISISDTDNVSRDIRKNKKTREQKCEEYKKILKDTAYKHNIPLKGVS